MPITYKNRKNKKYYLHEGKTKTGKSRYYFSMKTDGKLVDEIPDGYEIYEHPWNVQVFLRKAQPRQITDLEEHLVRKHLKKLETNRPYIIDIKAETITIFESSHDPDELTERFGDFFNRFNKSRRVTDSLVQSIMSEGSHCTPVLKFILENEKDRRFIAQRYCFRGSIDDWIYLDGPDRLEKLAQEYIKHLGQESFFDLI